MSPRDVNGILIEQRISYMGPEETTVPMLPCAGQHSIRGSPPGHTEHPAEQALSPLLARGENWASERLCATQNVKPLGEKPQPPEQGFPAQRCGRGVEGAALGVAAVEQRPGPAARPGTTVLEQKPVEQGLRPVLSVVLSTRRKQAQSRACSVRR